MNRRWVSDASPLILLAKVGRLAMLADLATELVIPRAVVSEVEAGPDDDAARKWMSGEGRRFVRDAGPVPASVAAWDLGHGEQAALSWTLRHEGWVALLDDGAARQAARALELPVLGTVGVILVAKAAGHLSRAAPLLEELVDAGLYVHDEVLHRALRLAGEAD